MDAVRLTETDIRAYTYCPYLYTQPKPEWILRPLSIFDETLRETIILGETWALQKDSVVTRSKLLSIWDKLWWPKVVAEEIETQEAERLALAATIKLNDYANYELTDYMHPTIGAGIKMQKPIGSSVLVVTADIVKIDLTEKVPTTIIIKFSSKLEELPALDPVAKAISYGLYSDNKENIKYIDMSLNKKVLTATPATFRAKEMQDIKSMLYHIEDGIRRNAFYPNPFACKDCKQCNFKF